MTLQEAKDVRGLTTEQKQLLLNIETTAKRFSRTPKDFAATTPTELKKELDTIIEKKKAKQTKQKEKQSSKKQCVELLKEMAEGQNAIISYSQLFERLKGIKQQIEKETKQKQVQKLIEQSGLTRNELVEYLSNN